MVRLVREDENLITLAMDEKEFGANHEYCIKLKNGVEDNCTSTIDTIKFQKGPVKEHGINGIQNVQLLAIVADTIKGFQETEFACRENAIALTKIEEAIMWLDKRTADRQARNVEGYHKI